MVSEMSGQDAGNAKISIATKTETTNPTSGFASQETLAPLSA